MSILTIDGPAGAGKSTIARGVAQALGWIHLDTGALYRAVTLAGLRAGFDPADQSAFEALAGSLELTLEEGTVAVGGVDVTDAIRSAEVTDAVAQVAAYAGVRRALLAHQRGVAERGDVVAEGRDIGTRVFPEALCKIWLTASLQERARRRRAELVRAGGSTGFEAVVAAIAERDAIDAGRDESPLRRADDAIEVDTTGLSVEQVCRTIVDLVTKAIG